ncbi:chloride channel protein [Paraburkholderia sp. UCT2]|uniref:chloride channel protein n=1 Tax=Paraburkholderia sp. UCT2 TaxID=2615208 RepID=UPI0016561EA3|nr:chloride channel protein [Paraburkholderia sp. UCT2]
MSPLVTALVAVLEAHLIDADCDILRRADDPRRPSLMLNLRHFHPARFRTIRGVDLEHRLAFAGAPTGLSAAFNAPLVNAVFAIKELTRSFDARMSGVIITAQSK